MSAKTKDKNVARKQLIDITKNKLQWPAILAHKLDKLRVPALTQGTPLSPGKIIGNKVAIRLSHFSPRDIKEYLSIVPSLVAIPRDLPCEVDNKKFDAGKYKAWVLPYPEGDGMSIMQILEDRIAHGDRQFMLDFATALKCQSETTEARCDFYLLMMQNHDEINCLKSPQEIRDFLELKRPGCIRGDAGGSESEGESGIGEENFNTLLREIGLPRGRG